ncbi:MAG: cell division protein FtsA [FCB group bacterium]|nr:cell division protein FtsA [FCB group bacterium]
MGMNFRQDNSIFAGLDVGTSKICCAIAQTGENDDTIKLLGIGSTPSTAMKNGTLINRDHIIEEIEKSISEAEIMAGVKVEQLCIGISGDHIRGINTQGAIPLNSADVPISGDRRIVKDDINKAIEFAKAINIPVDRDILHILPQEYVLDTLRGIKNPLGMSGRRLEARVHLVTVAHSAASNLTRCVEDLGLTVEGIVFQGLASALSTLDQDEKDLGVVLVDIGAGTCDVTVYTEGGIRHTGVVPYGADLITNDIAVMLQIGIQEAEAIKIKYASALASMASPKLSFDLPGKNDAVSRTMSEHELSRYVQARMEEILHLIGREIHRADISEKITYGLVLTGGGANLKNLAALTQNVLNMKTRVGIPTGFGGVLDVASEPQFATALGLLNWGVHQEDYAPPTKSSFKWKDVPKNIGNWFKDLF